MKIKLDPKDLIDINIGQEHLVFTRINRQTGECEVEIAKDWHVNSFCEKFTAWREKLNE